MCTRDQNLWITYNGEIYNHVELREELRHYGHQFVSGTDTEDIFYAYEDKNSMTYAVEARLPFLDHRLVEAVAAMPLSQKLRGGWTKYVLRNAMRGILPRRIETRKSILGFAVPEERWIRNEFRPDFEAAFGDAYFLPQYVEMDVLNKRFERFLSCRSLLPGSFFFRFFIFERWARAFLP